MYAVYQGIWAEKDGAWTSKEVRVSNPYPTIGAAHEAHEAMLEDDTSLSDTYVDLA